MTHTAKELRAIADIIALAEANYNEADSDTPIINSIDVESSSGGYIGKIVFNRDAFDYEFEASK